MVSCIFGLSLSALWTNPPRGVFILGWISGFIQITVLILLGFSWKGLKKIWKDSMITEKVLIAVFSFSFVLKLLLQLASADKYFALLAFRNPYIIIGYLHLVFLGLVSCSLLYLMIKSRHLIKSNRVMQWGVYGFVVIIMITEFLIVIQPLAIPSGFLLLFLASSIFPLAILLIMIPHRKDLEEVG
jgi:hypothetical protein